MRVGEGLLMSSSPSSETGGGGVCIARAAPARPASRRFGAATPGGMVLVPSAALPFCRAPAAPARVWLSLAMKQSPCSGPRGRPAAPFGLGLTSDDIGKPSSGPEPRSELAAGASLL